MSSSEYQELLSLFMDDELTEEQGAQLAAELRSNPELLRDFKQDLILWEIWSQHCTQERSEASFLAAWKTRLHAEADAVDFGNRMMKRVAGIGSVSENSMNSVATLWRRVWKPVLATTSAVLLGGLIMAGFAWWLLLSTSITPDGQQMTEDAQAAPAAEPAVKSAPVRSAEDQEGRQHLVSISGEAICPLCVLHLGHLHEPAVRFTQDGMTKVAYLKGNPTLAAIQPRFCSGPSPVEVRGRLVEIEGRLILDSAEVDFEKY